MREQFNHQPALPGLDGPEWDNPQPALPFEDELSDDTLMQALDTLHHSIDEREQAGEDSEIADVLLYEQLGALAVERGLMQPIEEDESLQALMRLEADIATIRENLNNPFGMTNETRGELEASLSELLESYHELVRR